MLEINTGGITQTNISTVQISVATLRIRSTGTEKGLNHKDTK